MAPINHGSANDEALSLSNYNRIVDTCNKFNNSRLDNASVMYDDGSGVFSLSEDIPEENKTHTLFKIGADKLACTIGQCVRNNVSVSLEPDPNYINEQWHTLDITDFTNAGVVEPINDDDIYYVYLEYDNTDVVPAPSPEYEPEVFPYGVTLKADKDLDYVGLTDPSGVVITSFDTSNAISGKRKIIGQVTLAPQSTSTYLIDTIVQTEDQKGDWITKFYMLDSETDIAASGGLRSTIEINPATTSPYFMKVQLSNVDKCAGNGSKAFPTFWSTSDEWDEIGPSGNLQWTSIDSNYEPQDAPNHNTLQITTDTNAANFPEAGQSFYRIHLYGSTAIQWDYSKSICYFESTEDDAGGQQQGTLKWAVIDSHYYDENPESAGGGAPEPTQFSLEVDSSTDWFQLYNFDIGGTTAMDNDERILIRWTDGTDTILKYASADNIGEWLRNYDSNWDSALYYEIGYWWDYNAYHSDLIDIKGGGDTDVDHGAYWNNVDATLGEYGSADTTYTKNNGTSIGDSSKALTIHLDNRTLNQGATPVITWGTAEVQIDTTLLDVNATGAITLDAGTLITVNASTSLDIDAGSNITMDAVGTITVTSGTGQTIDIKQGGLGGYGWAFHVGSYTEVYHDNEVVVKSGGSYVDLDPATELQINGTAGVTTDGFTKGILTDESAQNTAAESRVNDLLVGWGLL